MEFEKTELVHLAISVLTITAAFYILLTKLGSDIALSTVFLTVGIAFASHEFTHKAVAQKFGCVAVYRTWFSGLILALAFAVLTPFVFAAPGAVYIKKKYLSMRENGLISISGPLTNLALAFVFFWIFLNTGFSSIGFWGFRINIFLAFFNMVPFPPLDGYKVVKWSPVVWGVVFFSLVYLNFFFL